MKPLDQELHANMLDKPVIIINLDILLCLQVNIFFSLENIVMPPTNKYKTQLRSFKFHFSGEIVAMISSKEDFDM